MAREVCLECGSVCSRERVVALEFWAEYHDGRPFYASHSDGDGTAWCKRCFPTESLLMRYLWSLLGCTRCVMMGEVHQITMAFDSGRRSLPIKPHSVFPETGNESPSGLHKALL